jgi:hypothetical protein
MVPVTCKISIKHLEIMKWTTIPIVTAVMVVILLQMRTKSDACWLSRSRSLGSGAAMTD